MITRRELTIFILALVGLLVPYIGLMIAGSYLLWQNGLFWLYGGITAALTVAFYHILSRLHHRRQKEIEFLDFYTPESWPPREKQAWARVQAVMDAVMRGEYTVNKLDDFRPIFLRLLRDVAEYYHPGKSDAYLDAPLPHIMKVLEEALRDVRKVTNEYVPASHILTLRDYFQLKKGYDFLQRVNLVYRVVMMAVSPMGTLWREVRRYATRGVIDVSADEGKRRLIAYAVSRVGFYLIELYSGRVIIDEEEYIRFKRTAAQKELRQTEMVSELPEAEPARIVIVGQMKAGKSSLVNALRGAWSAETDVLLCTSNAQSFLLTPMPGQDDPRATLPGPVILVDTPGYDDNSGEAAVRNMRREIEQADMLVLVCSARSAARQADRQFLRAFRQFFQQAPNRMAPPVIVVASCIDEVRPWHEWQPPYSWQGDIPENRLTPKEREIRKLLQAIKRDLELSDQDLVIPVCTHPERIYNVAEGLIPVLVSHWRWVQGVRDTRHRHVLQRSSRYRRMFRQIGNAISGIVNGRLGRELAGIKGGSRSSHPRGGSDAASPKR